LKVKLQAALTDAAHRFRGAARTGSSGTDRQEKAWATISATTGRPAILDPLTMTIAHKA
jgi:hypothetical protein